MRIKNTISFFIATLLFIVSGCTSAPKPPDATATIDGENIELSKGSYQWEEQGTITNAIDVPPMERAKELEKTIIDRNSFATINFSDGSDPQLTANSWEEVKGERRKKDLSLEGNQLKFPSKTGRYVFEIVAEWFNGDASYTFVVEVQ